MQNWKKYDSIIEFLIYVHINLTWHEILNYQIILVIKFCDNMYNKDIYLKLIKITNLQTKDLAIINKLLWNSKVKHEK